MPTFWSSTVAPSLSVLPITCAALDAAAEHRQAPRPRVVVAARLRPAGVDVRRPAELAHPDHQRAVEQAPVLQVVDQGGRSAASTCPESVLTRVKLSWWVSQPPRLTSTNGTPDLDQPAGHQARRRRTARCRTSPRLADGSGDRSNAFASFDCISLTARS